MGSNEGRYAYDGPGDNNITIDRLHYYFPIGENLTMYTMAKLAGHHFYADTFNAGLDVGGGANGALSRFAERNPLYRFGLDNNSAGVGFKYDLGNFGEASIGYIASSASNPAPDKGLFDGSYSAMAQLVITPSDNFKLGVNYFNNYSDFNSSIGLGGTGTPLANTAISDRFGSGPIKSNAFGLQALYDIDENVSLRGWVGYIDVDSTTSTNEGEVWTYAGVIALNNLGKDDKDMAYLLVGVEPYLAKATNSSGIIPIAPNDVDRDPVHIELAYKKSVADGITVTPGVIWLAGQPNSNSKDILIGTLRTTFSF
ncbi:MAG: carbohydrate porin [Synechococcaceae cyanobacterium RL_1_2]|nr:carbohydrate porin [Synechococcaceae cyanobacterium RL_1_2]